MSSKTTQEGQTASTRRGRPRIPEQFKRRHAVHVQINDLQREALDALIDYLVRQTGDAPNQQVTVGWTFLEQAKQLKIGPFAENGQDQ